MNFFHFFIFQMQKLYKKSPTLPFIFQLMCWQSTWIQCNIFLNIKYMSACIPYNVTEKITSFKHMTSSGGKGRWEWGGGGGVSRVQGFKGSKPWVKHLEALLTFHWSNFFFFSFRQEFNPWKNTLQKTKLTKNKETIEPYTIIYILLGIMELKYVYQVAFG